MADLKVKYGSWTDLTITLASLATSSTHLVGRESTAIDNTTNLYVDVLCGGHITTGTSPTADTQIQVWVYGDNTGLTTYPDVLDGTDSAETFASDEVRNAAVRLALSITVNGTSDNTYWIHPFSIAGLFGGLMPAKWGLWVTHNTAVNLNSTGSNHKLSYYGFHGQSV